MANQLQTNLDEILNEKETKILPENIKKDVQIFGIVGTLESGKQEYIGYNTMKELNAQTDNTNIEIGQKAVLYGPNKIPLEIDKMFNMIIELSKTFTITEEQKTYIANNNRVDISTQGDHELYISSVSFNIYPTYAELYVNSPMGMGGNMIARYESTDGLTYTGMDEYEYHDWMAGGITHKTFVYENIECGNAVYNEHNKTDENTFAFNILKTLLKSVGIVKLQGVYKYEDNISNSYKIQYLMNMSYDGSVKNGNTNDFVYADKAYSFIQEQYNNLPDKANTTSEIMVIDTIDENKNVISGDIYIYPDSINTFLIILEDNTVNAGFRHNTCKKYHFDISTNTFTFVEDVLNNEVKSYRGSYDNYSLQIIATINNNAKIITSNDMNYADVYEVTYYQSGEYLSYNYPTQYSSQYKILPTQFTITNNDVDDVIGKYVMLGKDGEVETNDTWTRRFDIEKYSKIMPFTNFNKPVNLSYNLNKCKLPELQNELALQLGNLKHIKLTDLTNKYLQYGINANCKTEYGFSDVYETLNTIDVTSVPHMSEFNGYFYQTNRYEYIDSNGIVHLLYTSTRNKYAFYFEINPITGEYTSKQYETAGDDSQYALSVGDYWCIVSRNTDSSSTKFIQKIQVIEKQTGNINNTFEVNYGTIANLYGFNNAIWFNGDIPSASTFNSLVCAKIYNNSKYSYSIYKYDSNTSSTLVTSDTTGRYELYFIHTCKNEIIIQYKTNSSDISEEHLVYPVNLAKRIYNRSYVTVDGASQVSYTIIDDKTSTKYTVVNGEEVDVSTIQQPKETFMIDGVKYYKADIAPTEDGYNCELENAETGQIVTKAVPSFYYNLTTHNDYEYVSDVIFDEDDDRNYDTNEYTYSIIIRRYKFSGYEGKVITDMSDGTDLICLYNIQNSGTDIRNLNHAYLLSADNLDIITSGNGPAEITQNEYTDALNTSNEILGEEVQ